MWVAVCRSVVAVNVRVGSRPGGRRSDGGEAASMLARPGPGGPRSSCCSALRVSLDPSFASPAPNFVVFPILCSRYPCALVLALGLCGLGLAALWGFMAGSTCGSAMGVREKSLLTCSAPARWRLWASPFLP